MKTPNIDELKKESIDFAMNYSGCPICTPYRATLITGQHPLTTGMFMNDVPLGKREHCLGNVFLEAGYDTAYIGKWHIDGHGREGFIPKERRCGFEYWKVLECTHDYMNSFYYDGDDTKLKKWDGYDAYAQTADAVSYIHNHCKENSEKPFFLMLSLGTPHNPYDEAPKELLDLYDEEKLIIPPNVPQQNRDEARRMLKGYYAHITGLDECVRKISQAIKDQGIYEDTIFILTSDHGDCVMSHCENEPNNKQIFYDESIHVPFLLRYPRLNKGGEEIQRPFDAADIFPTLVDLCGITVPETCEGESFVPLLKGSGDVKSKEVLIAAYSPFHDWCEEKGGVEYRGLRTDRYTYVKTIRGEEYLFDNEKDPWQMKNVSEEAEYSSIRKELEKRLDEKLKERDDAFLPKEELWKKYGYVADGMYDAIPYDKSEGWWKNMLKHRENYRD